MRTLLIIGLVSLTVPAGAETFAVVMPGDVKDALGLTLARGYPKVADGARVLGYCATRAQAEARRDLLLLTTGSTAEVRPSAKGRATTCPKLAAVKTRAPKRGLLDVKEKAVDSAVKGFAWRIGRAPGNRKTKGCVRLHLQVRHSDKLLAEHTALDECEDRCGEDGQGCTTTAYEAQGYETLGTRSFVWVKTHSEWHDNGSVNVDLYGFACGKIRKVWGYQWLSPAEKTVASLAATDGWRSVTATLDEPGEKVTRSLVWDADRCMYQPAPSK